MSRFAPSETSNTAPTPVPFSPFSTASSFASDFTATSEEPADLGAFSTIFRALTQLQRPNGFGMSRANSRSPSSSEQTPSASPMTYATTDLPPDTTEDESDVRHFRSSSSSSSFTPSDAEESDAYISDIFGFTSISPSARRAHGSSSRPSTSRRESKRGGTVWNEDPVASYLSPSARTEQHNDGSLSPVDLPSLGLGAFESALSFLAGERARLTSKLERDINGSNHNTSALNSPTSRMPGYRSPPVFPIIHTTEPSPIASSPQQSASKGKKKQNRKGRKERGRSRADNASVSNLLNPNLNDPPPDTSSAGDSPPSSEEQRARLWGRTGDRLGVEHLNHRRSKSKNRVRSSSFKAATQQAAAADDTTAGISDEAREGPRPSPTTPATELRGHLLSMATRLSELFPADARLLGALPFELDRFSAAGGFIPREDVGGIGADGTSGYWDGSSANAGEKGKVHVFIDHSNILVGFLTWVEREFREHRRSSNISIAGVTTTIPSFIPKKPKMSHASLALLLERGRRIGKRVIVASSPTYQPLDDMHDMGYEVSVLQRVAIKEGGHVSGGTGTSTPVGNSPKATAERPKFGKGGRSGHRSDRRDSLRSSAASSNGTPDSLGAGASTANSFDGGSGGSSTESGNLPVNFNLQYNGTPLWTLNDPSPSSYTQPPPVSGNNRRHGHRRFPSAPSVLSPSTSSSIPDTFSLGGNDTPLAAGTPNGTSSSTSTRQRYREEAVDELLQLKILQVLIEAPSPAPKGSTIVLATGDGASSQFNRDGFLGCARMAVQRGWRVELVGWESGRSRAWGELASELRERKERSGRDGGRVQGGLYMINLDNWGWDIYDSRASA